MQLQIPSDEILVNLDGHMSSANSELLQTCPKDNITVIAIPAHNSHILHRLDYTINVSLNEKANILISATESSFVPFTVFPFD